MRRSQRACKALTHQRRVPIWPQASKQTQNTLRALHLVAATQLDTHITCTFSAMLTCHIKYLVIHTHSRHYFKILKGAFIISVARRGRVSEWYFNEAAAAALRLMCDTSFFYCVMSRAALLFVCAHVAEWRRHSGTRIMKGGAEKEKAPPSVGVTLGRHNSARHGSLKTNCGCPNLCTREGRQLVSLLVCREIINWRWWAEVFFSGPRSSRSQNSMLKGERPPLFLSLLLNDTPLAFAIRPSPRHGLHLAS